MNATVELMGTSLLAGIVAMGVLFLLLWFRPAWLPLDRPNPRSLHQRPTPRIGGLGIMAGTAALACLAPPAGELGWLAAIAGLLGLVSLADDIGGIPVVLRLAAHVAAAGFAIAAVLRVDGWVLPVVAVVALVWMTNLFNFMDGADGLAGGMAVLGFGSYGLAAHGMAAHGMAAFPIAAMTWGIAAAAAGFLVFNFHPARLFLGDCGSIPLGFAAGAIGLLGWQQAVWPLWFPAAVFAPFIFDATATLARRAARGETLWMAHNEHYYQRAIRMGFGKRRTILCCYGLMVFCGATALFARNLDAGGQGAGLAAIAAVLVAAMLLLDRRWRASGARSRKES